MANGVTLSIFESEWPSCRLRLASPIGENPLFAIIQYSPLPRERLYLFDSFDLFVLASTRWCCARMTDKLRRRLEVGCVGVFFVCVVFVKSPPPSRAIASVGIKTAGHA